MGEGGLRGGRRGRARASGKEGAFWEEEIKHLPKQVLGTLLGGRLLRLRKQPALRDPSQSWGWHSEEEASVVGEYSVAGAKPRGPGRTRRGGGRETRHFSGHRAPTRALEAGRWLDW